MKPFVIFAAVLLGVVLGFWLVMSSELKKAKANGVRAFAAGVPTNSNPYFGRNFDFANAWLDGYIEAKAAAEKNK